MSFSREPSSGSGMSGLREERVKLRLAFGGRFQLDAASQCYKYSGGEFYNESLPASAKYSDFMFKLSEKLKTAVSVRYLSPGEELDPEALITVSDDDDLQELMDEYFDHLQRPGTPSKTFRIRVFAFPATEEPLTPDEIMHGDTYFGVLGHPIRRLQLQCGSSHEHSHDHSSWCSTPSSGGSPSARLASDAEAEYFISRNGSHAPMPESTHHSAHSMYGPKPQRSAGALDSELERRALEHYRASVNNPNFYGGWAANGGQTWHQQQCWQAGEYADECEDFSCYTTSAGHSFAADHSSLYAGVVGVQGLDDDSCYQEASEGGPGAAKSSNLRTAHVEGWIPGGACNGEAYDEYETYDAEEEGQEGQQNKEQLLPGDLLAPLTPPQEGGDGQNWDRQLPADPWDMSPGHQATAEIIIAAPEKLPSQAAATAASLAASAEAASPANGFANLPSHISAFGDEINEEQQAAAAALAVADTPLQHADRPERGTLRTQEYELHNGAGSAFGDAGSTTKQAGGKQGQAASGEAHAEASPATQQGMVFMDGVVNASKARAQAAGPGAARGAAGAANGAGRTRCSDSGDSVASLQRIRAVHKVPRASVKVLRKIGEGAFGEVSVATAPLYGTVAVKWLKSERFSKYSQSFLREAGVLAELNHPNVLRFYGVVTSDPVTSDATGDASIVGIITEYVRGGSLAQYLRAAKGPLPLWLRAEMALHAANGLAYLHELSVVHFDLKPDNLLLEGGDAGATSPGSSVHNGHCHVSGGSSGRLGGSRPRGVSDGGGSSSAGALAAAADGFGAAPVVKVADFGLSKHKLNSYVSDCRDLRGTLPYMAPELVADPGRVSEKADVWSLGVVMWEMLTRAVPFADLTPQQILLGLMYGNLHLDAPAWCEPEWRGLLEACMEPNPARRPSMKELARQLEAIRDQQLAIAAMGRQ